MKGSGGRLGARYRERAAPKTGEIRQKRGDTLNRNLPKPIPRFRDDTTLKSMRKVTGQMSIEKVRQVVARGPGEWAVRTVGSGRATKVFSSQKKAILFARGVSKKEGTDLYIQSSDGRVRQKANYASRDYSGRVLKR
jgi:hypothetical protein